MGEYTSTISPHIGLEVAEPTLQGATEPSVARFAYTDSRHGLHPAVHSDSVHLGRRDALNAAADLLELAGEYALAEPVRKEAAIEPLKVLRRGDFVRLVSPPVGHEKHANAVVVVTEPTVESPCYPDSFLTVLILDGIFLQAQRKELGQPLDVDDDGEKLIVG